MERLICGSGDGSTLTVVPTAIGPVGAVTCWENYMAPLRLAMTIEGSSSICARRSAPLPNLLWQSKPAHTGRGTCTRQPQGPTGDKQEVGSMVASEETIAAVRGVLDRFAATYSAKDEAGVLGCFAVGSDGVLVGTGADEWRVGDAAVRVQVERDFAQADSLSIEYGELRIDGTDGVAWFAAKATVRASVGGEPFESALRLTGVVSHQGDGWRIVQSHLSFPAEAQEPGQSF